MTHYFAIKIQSLKTNNNSSKNRQNSHNFHEHQIRHMRECVDQGGICFALIRFVELDQMYVFPATSLFEYWQRQLHGGRKSIPLTAIIQDGYPVQYGLNPRLHYLTAVDQLIAAKKH